MSQSQHSSAQGELIVSWVLVLIEPAKVHLHGRLSTVCSPPMVYDGLMLVCDSLCDGPDSD